MEGFFVCIEKINRNSIMLDEQNLTIMTTVSNPHIPQKSPAQRRLGLFAWLAFSVGLFFGSAAIIWSSFVDRTIWWIVGFILLVTSLIIMLMCKVMLGDTRREILASKPAVNFWDDSNWRRMENKRLILVWLEVLMIVTTVVISIYCVAFMFLDPGETFLGMERLPKSFDAEFFGTFRVFLLAPIMIGSGLLMIDWFLIAPPLRELTKALNDFANNHRSSLRGSSG
jgi:hypothetical protein